MKPAIVILIGVATLYAGPYVGEPLYCHGGAGYRYSEVTPVWVALDVSLYEAGIVSCGDRIWIMGDGWKLEALALDAGRLLGHEVVTWPGVPIVVDIPLFAAPFDPVWGALSSARAIVVDVTKAAAELERWIER